MCIFMCVCMRVFISQLMHNFNTRRQRQQPQASTITQTMSLYTSDSATTCSQTAEQTQDRASTSNVISKCTTDTVTVCSQASQDHASSQSGRVVTEAHVTCVSVSRQESSVNTNTKVREKALAYEHRLQTMRRTWSANYGPNRQRPCIQPKPDIHVDCANEQYSHACNAQDVKVQVKVEESMSESVSIGKYTAAQDAPGMVSSSCHASQSAVNNDLRGGNTPSCSNNMHVKIDSEGEQGHAHHTYTEPDINNGSEHVNFDCLPDSSDIDQDSVDISRENHMDISRHSDEVDAPMPACAPPIPTPVSIPRNNIVWPDLATCGPQRPRRVLPWDMGSPSPAPESRQEDKDASSDLSLCDPRRPRRVLPWNMESRMHAQSHVKCMQLHTSRTDENLSDDVKLLQTKTDVTDNMLVLEAKVCTAASTTMPSHRRPVRILPTEIFKQMTQTHPDALLPLKGFKSKARLSAFHDILLLEAVGTHNSARKQQSKCGHNSRDDLGNGSAIASVPSQDENEDVYHFTLEAKLTRTQRDTQTSARPQCNERNPSVNRRQNSLDSDSSSSRRDGWEMTVQEHAARAAAVPSEPKRRRHSSHVDSGRGYDDCLNHTALEHTIQAGICGEFRGSPPSLRSDAACDASSCTMHEHATRGGTPGESRRSRPRDNDHDDDDDKPHEFPSAGSCGRNGGVTLAHGSSMVACDNNDKKLAGGSKSLRAAKSDEIRAPSMNARGDTNRLVAGSKKGSKRLQGVGAFSQQAVTVHKSPRRGCMELSEGSLEHVDLEGSVENMRFLHSNKEKCLAALSSLNPFDCDVSMTNGSVVCSRKERCLKTTSSNHGDQELYMVVGNREERCMETTIHHHVDQEESMPKSSLVCSREENCLETTSPDHVNQEGTKEKRSLVCNRKERCIETTISHHVEQHDNKKRGSLDCNRKERCLDASSSSLQVEQKSMAKKRRLSAFA
jgi:hypothetical protein